MALLRAKYGSTIENIEVSLFKSKKELETAQKSLLSRQTFYENELADLDKTENFLRESLLNLWKTYGVKGVPFQESEIEAQRKEIQVKKMAYEARLRELKLDSHWNPSFIKSSIKTSDELELELTYNLIKESESKIKELQEKKLFEAYSSPRKIAIHLQIEDEIANIERLKRNLYFGKSKLEVEQKLYEAKRKEILSKSESFNPEVIIFKSDMENFKSKADSLSSRIVSSKVLLEKSVYSPSHSIEFEVNKNDLGKKSYEIDQLRSQLAKLKIRYSALGYPAFTSLYEFSKLESELMHREIEINSYLKEKERLRDNVERIRKDDLILKTISQPIITGPLLSLSSPYKSIYINSNEMISPNKSNNSRSLGPLTPLQAFYEKQSLELKTMIIENEKKKLIEEAKRRQEEIKGLKRIIEEKDREINTYISL